MVINKNWLFNVYRNADAGEDAGGASTTGVQTETDNTDNTDTSTVLTGTDSDADTGAADDTGGEDGNIDAAGDDTDASSQTPPDTYADFVMPEGVELDQGLLDSATPILQKYKVSQEDAQGLADAIAKQVQASSESQVDAFNQLMNDWQEQSKNDKEFGGDKFEENVAVARSAIDKFGTPELKQLLEEHGVGNHPEVIRFMVKVGKLTAEDVPGGTTTPTSKSQDRVSLLYPNDKTA